MTAISLCVGENYVADGVSKIHRAGMHTGRECQIWPGDNRGTGAAYKYKDDIWQIEIQ